MADPDHRSLMTMIDRLDITEGSSRQFPQLLYANTGTQRGHDPVRRIGNGMARHDGLPANQTPTLHSIIDPASNLRRT
jgi:hypothetical protein